MKGCEPLWPSWGYGRDVISMGVPNKDLLLNYTKHLIKRKFGFDINTILKNSIILKNIKEQSKLTQFF